MTQIDIGITIASPVSSIAYDKILSDIYYSHAHIQLCDNNKNLITRWEVFSFKIILIDFS